MTEKNLKPTTVADYLKKHSKITLFTLPSGAVFEIKKISPEFYIENEGSVVDGIDDITDKEERKKIIQEKLKTKYDNMSIEEKREFQKKQMILYKKLVIQAVVNPAVSFEVEEGKLHIDDIVVTEDFYPLVKAISDFSGGEELKPFRSEPESSNT